jgi:hypothetical protein
VFSGVDFLQPPPSTTNAVSSPSPQVLMNIARDLVQNCGPKFKVQSSKHGWHEGQALDVEIVDYHQEIMKERIALGAAAVTPGEILAEEFLKPMGLSQRELARRMGVKPM